MSPTGLLGLTPGDNVLTGSLGGAGADPYDYINFNVPEGRVLSRLVVESYDWGLVYDYAPVILHSGGMADGPDVAFLLATGMNTGTDLLQFGLAPGVLPAGEYTLRIGVLSGGGDSPGDRTNYVISLGSDPIPEPSCVVLACLAGIGVLTGRGRFRSGGLHGAGSRDVE